MLGLESGQFCTVFALHDHGVLKRSAIAFGSTTSLSLLLLLLCTCCLPHRREGGGGPGFKIRVMVEVRGFEESRV